MRERLSPSEVCPGPDGADQNDEHDEVKHEDPAEQTQRNDSVLPGGPRMELCCRQVTGVGGRIDVVPVRQQRVDGGRQKNSQFTMNQPVGFSIGGGPYIGGR